MKVRIELNHSCHKKGCEGRPGDVIEVSAEDAQYLLERGGGKIVGHVDGKPAAISSTIGGHEVNWLSPMFQDMPVERAILGLVRQLSGHLRPIQLDLTDSEWTAFRALAKHGAIEGILRFRYTDLSGSERVDYHRVRGDYVRTTTNINVVARGDAPSELQLVQARLTTVGEQWQVWLQQENAWDPTREAGVTLIREVRAFVLKLIFDSDRVPGSVTTVFPPSDEPDGPPASESALTTNERVDWTAGKWRRYPWPGGCADPRAAAWTFTEPKDEWRKPLERWLPNYCWPDEPDRAALERVLMAAPFNLPPADFSAMVLPIDRVVTLLDSMAVAPLTETEAIAGAAGRCDDSTTQHESKLAPEPDDRTTGKGMSRDEANVKAREHLEKNPQATARELADAIGCALGQIPNLAAWKAVQEQLQKGRRPRVPGTVSLTSKLEANIDERGKIGNSISRTHRDDEQIDELIAEQVADAESNEVSDDPRSVPSRKTAG